MSDDREACAHQYEVVYECRTCQHAKDHQRHDPVRPLNHPRYDGTRYGQHIYREMIAIVCALCEDDDPPSALADEMMHCAVCGHDEHDGVKCTEDVESHSREYDIDVCGCRRYCTSESDHVRRYGWPIDTRTASEARQDES